MRKMGVRSIALALGLVLFLPGVASAQVVKTQGGDEFRVPDCLGPSGAYCQWTPIGSDVKINVSDGGIAETPYRFTRPAFPDRNVTNVAVAVVDTTPCNAGDFEATWRYTGADNQFVTVTTSLSSASGAAHCRINFVKVTFN